MISGLRCRNVAPIGNLYGFRTGFSQRLSILDSSYLSCANRIFPHSTRLWHVKRRKFSAYTQRRNIAFLDEYLQTYDLKHTTVEVDQLTLSHIGEHVTLSGYFGQRSDLTKSLSFAHLLDKSLNTSVQLVSKVSESQPHDLHDLFKSIPANVPVTVSGYVQRKVKPKEPPRGSDVQRNEDCEIAITQLVALNGLGRNVAQQDEAYIAPEDRHLQIRHSRSLRNALAFRSAVNKACHKYFAENDDWLEVETPLLFKSTPEGAREFLVPTRTAGQAYALPQSPQQYKQILMASGIPRYYQFARCFRDEDLRADRQPEFTQLDMEMAFATGQDVMCHTENLIKAVWNSLLPGVLTVEKEQFPRLSYRDAMSRYGSDKPDTRLGSEISRIDHMLPLDLISKIGPLVQPTVEVFKIGVAEEPTQARRFVDDFMGSPEATPFIDNPEGQPGIFVYDPRKPLSGLHPFGFEAAEHVEEHLELEEGDVVFLQARKTAPFSGGSTPIGNLRLTVHRAAVAQNLRPMPTGWNFLWVTDFPLFSPTSASEPGQGGTAGFASTHHPFTAPATAEDVRLLATDPSSAKADHYDLVLNGVELGGGSRRIHNADVQRYVLRDVLKMDLERLVDFEHLLKVLGSGCPPHAGIALGFDRLVATMLGKDSIREVIPFPKSGKGEDLLVKSPGRMTEKQLETYHLQLKT